MSDGHGLSRVQTFLLKTLRPSTQDKYLQALAHLNSDLTVAGIVWVELTEAEQDSFLAEWVLDGYESGRGRQDYGCALSAVQKVNPRCVYKTAWKVYDAWGVEAPPRQAPAAPPELIYGYDTLRFAAQPSAACHRHAVLLFRSSTGS